jgi:hypothetical protein
MIRSFKHAGLEKFFATGSKAGIQPAHAAKLEVLLTALNKADSVSAMGGPSLESPCTARRSQGPLVGQSEWQLAHHLSLRRHGR